MAGWQGVGVKLALTGSDGLRGGFRLPKQAVRGSEGCLEIQEFQGPFTGRCPQPG